MKHIHHLTASWLLVAMVIAVALGETIALTVSKAFSFRCPVVAVAALCIGLVAGGVSLIYDGSE